MVTHGVQAADERINWALSFLMNFYYLPSLFFVDKRIFLKSSVSHQLAALYVRVPINLTSKGDCTMAIKSLVLATVILAATSAFAAEQAAPAAAAKEAAKEAKESAKVTKEASK